VLIGTNIVKVAAGRASPSVAVPTPPREDLENLGSPAGRGHLEATSVAELLNVTADERLDGTLSVRTSAGHGRIHVRDGAVYAASIDSLPGAPSHKCVLRILGWSQGEYAISGPQAALGDAVNLPIAELLVDGLFKLDEWEVLKQRLPARMCLARPVTAPLRDLSDVELDLLQEVHNLEDTVRVIDAMPEVDHMLASQLLELLDSGYLRSTGGA
jgi:hypothetical protein